MERFFRLIFLVVLLAVGTLTMAFEFNVGIAYSFTGQLSYVAELNTLGLPSPGPATTSGFSVLFLTDFANNYLLALGGVAKYDIKLEIGVVSLFGMGGMLVPVNDFGFEKITSIVRIGAKYYMGGFTLNTGIYSLFYSTGTKGEGLEVSLGFAF